MKNILVALSVICFVTLSVAYEGETSAENISDELFYIQQNLPYVSNLTLSNVREIILGTHSDVAKLAKNAVATGKTSKVGSETASLLTAASKKINAAIQTTLVANDNQLRNQIKGTPASDPKAVQNASDAAENLIGSFITSASKTIKTTVNGIKENIANTMINVVNVINSSKRNAPVSSKVNKILNDAFEKDLSNYDAKANEVKQLTAVVSNQVHEAVEAAIAHLA